MPYGTTKCTICKQQLHQDAKYCQSCAYKKGKADLDSFYSQVDCFYEFNIHGSKLLIVNLLVEWFL